MLKFVSNFLQKEPLISFVLLVIVVSCNPARKLNDGEYLLAKVKIKDDKTKVTRSDIGSYIKQKPNRKIFKVIPFHLMLYNLANQEKVKIKRAKKDKKLKDKNDQRISKGKKSKQNNRQLLGEWLMNVGEAPVIYDSTLTHRSDLQVHQLLTDHLAQLHGAGRSRCPVKNVRRWSFRP